MAQERVILVFDFEEWKSKEEALVRARTVRLNLGDKKRIFVIKEEVPWPEVQEK